MKALKAVRPSPATVIASIALLVALAGTGYAASSLPANSVGNKQLKANAVTSSKVKDHALLKVDFAAGQLPRGPAGAPGPPGAAGSPGAQGARGPTGPAGGSASGLWAVINPDGSISRRSGALSASHTQTGVYRVQFNRNITQCAWLATIGSGASTTAYGFIEAELASSTTDSVQVGTRDTNAVAADRGFIVTVLC